MSSPNPYAPPESQVADVASPALRASPPLWNPRVAANWSLLFSPIFGSLVQMKNWQALGEPGKALQSRNWAIGSLVFFVMLTLLSLLLPDTRALDGASRLLALALLLTWYYANGKSQYTYVLARFGKDYPKRGWGKPLLVALGVTFGFFVVVFVIALIWGAIKGTA